MAHSRAGWCVVRPAPIVPATSGRRGLTLIEVVVALAVSGLVLLAARQLIESVADHTRRISVPARKAEREANADRLLRSLVGRIEIGPGIQFAGDARRARFTTWCDDAGGWQVQCAVALVIDSLGGRQTLRAISNTGETWTIRAGLAAVELRYLSDASGGGQWRPTWGPAITTPIAIGVITDGDTTIVRVGERG